MDGHADSNTEWISTVAITDLIGAISAKHVLLVVDSCYSGALTRSALARLEAGMSEEARRHWLEVVAAKRSRTNLSSGDLKPVLDIGGGEHSVFAKAWLDVLKNNDDILEGQRVYREIAARVAYAADASSSSRSPSTRPSSSRAMSRGTSSSCRRRTRDRERGARPRIARGVRV